MTAKSEKKEEKKKAANEELAKMQEDLDKANADAGKYLDMARRLQADFDNFRKRTQRENEEFRKFASEDVVKDMLGIVDDLDRALNSATEENDLVKGVRSIRQNMIKALEAKGLKEIPADGKFDPEYHEALCAVDGDEDGNIAEVFQKGYTLNGRVVRFAKVKVTKKTEDKTEGE
jgi:molecular chaperone GrpE